MPDFFRSQMSDKPKPEASADCAPARGSTTPDWNRAKMEIEIALQAVSRAKTEATIRMTISHLEQAIEALRPVW